MITFTCNLQEGVIPDELRPTLTAELARISASVLDIPAADVDVGYYFVRHGFGFRGGEVSTTSTVSGQLSEPLDQLTRVELLTQICDMWCAKTGCAVDEVIVSARDPQ